MPDVQFYRPTAADSARMLRWRNSDRVRANMFDDSIILAEVHERWFASLLADPVRDPFVMHLDGLPVGYLCIDGIDGPECSWGCYLGETAVWPGVGVVMEVRALDRAFGHVDVDALCAEVLRHNIGPQRMHEWLGYTFVGVRPEASTRDGVAVDALQYRYERALWRERRPGVVTRLPRRIREVIDAAEFHVADGA